MTAAHPSLLAFSVGTSTRRRRSESCWQAQALLEGLAAIALVGAASFTLAFLALRGRTARG
jgi:hypothetical protein